jgi:hypothetical protein
MCGKEGRGWQEEGRRAATASRRVALISSLPPLSAFFFFWWRQVETFVEHIREGVRLAGEDMNALLVFSGGETRFSAGPRSEAQSYWMVAEHSSWFGQDPESMQSSHSLLHRPILPLPTTSPLLSSFPFFSLLFSSLLFSLVPFLLWARSADSQHDRGVCAGLV